ncbi:LAMI_0F06766g1_1 [Lachancea mirantina]|uniref:non-specific serine/threonine protein kinase n=1 Tax=Lachancea mirantina TaxID=1230905 RepID=A0A1G4JZ80_9SACH|nr:LAMI_0F06766g1_1 [Lachancea mirantina]
MQVMSENIVHSENRSDGELWDAEPKLAAAGLSLPGGSDYSLRELVSFPNESTRAYSYNPLSPNSLAVRLRILKRSLEIMIHNPSLLKEHESVDHKRMQTPSWSRAEAPLSALGQKSRPQLGRSSSHEGILSHQRTSKLRNASSAALSALFRGPETGAIPSGDMQRTFSSPRPSLMPRASHPSPRTIAETPSSESSSARSSIAESSSVLDPNASVSSFYQTNGNNSTDVLQTKRDDLESLLHLLNEALQNHLFSKASNLHRMSLFNINKLSLGLNGKDNGDPISAEGKQEKMLKKKLLDSLAQPFFESFTTDSAPDEEVVDGKDFGRFSPDNFSFANFQTTAPENNRILHVFISGKNSSPQAIFSCIHEYPWNFKSANDLACLTFGISRNALRALTLLDLIHSDSRNFVLNKLTSTENEELVFAGEIVGIVQPGAQSSRLVWASLWAKRKNGLLVCVFEKVPCDYMDMLLDLNDFTVESITGGEGLSFRDQEESGAKENQAEMKDFLGKETAPAKNDIHIVKTLSGSLTKLIDDVRNGDVFTEDDDLLPMCIRVSQHINRVRYFTLNHLSYNIPCAVSCTILENGMKLKIHSLPYQAGIFILNSSNFKLISFNKSISKNMFGLHASELINKDITEIIPPFCDIIDHIRTEHPNLDINSPKNKGLVLTEHFFRKMHSELDPVGNFYDSIGIDAIHRDESVIKVDIQLRVMDSSTVILWITHSRDVLFQNYTTNPSQLQILKENEIASVTSNSSSASSSKTQSKRYNAHELKSLGTKPEKPSPENNTEKVGIKKEGGEPSIKHESSFEDGSQDISMDKLDEELATRLQIAKTFSQDKAQFVKDDNFKLDENLIRSLTSYSPNPTPDTSSSSMDKVETALGSTIPAEKFPTLPVCKIGALKHVKRFSDFVVLQKMGEGAYGKVDLCMNKADKYVVVIKLIFKERILVDTWVRDRSLGTIPSEIQIMAALNKKPHENILTLLDFFEDDEYYYIETPIHGTTGSIDLFDLIELKTNMTEHESKLIFKQIVSGMQHLHDNGIVHRDIKDENIIVDNKGCVKIIDFGSAAYVKSGPFDVFVGTIDYAAPEVLGGEPYDGKPQDVWAMGVLLYTIVFKENPFYNIDEILDGDLRINANLAISDGCIALVTKILDRSVPQRPSVHDINNDKWLEL